MPQYSTYHLRTQILRQIADFWHTKHFSPSIRELAAAIGTTEFTIHYNLHRLQEMGYLTIEPKTSRSIVLTAKGKQGYVEIVAH